MPSNKTRSVKRAGPRQPQRPQEGGGRVRNVASGVAGLVRNTAATVLSGVRDVGTEVALVAVAAARGSIRAAGEIGADVGRLAIDAATGAIQAADRIGTVAGRAANDLVDSTVKGVGSRDRKRAAVTPSPERSTTGSRMLAARKPLARRLSRTAGRGVRKASRRDSGVA